jgi:hypothetical protein
VDLDEPADPLDGRADLVADRPVGRDGRDQHGDPVAGQEPGDIADAADVLVPVGPGEPQPLGEMGADHVAVEDLDRAAEAGKPLGDQVGDGGLAGRGQAGEPDGDSVGVRAR